MELSRIFDIFEKNFEPVNSEIGFKKKDRTEDTLAYGGKQGVYRLVYDKKSNIISFECSFEDKGDKTEYNTIARSLLEPASCDEKEAQSVSNDMIEEIEGMFKSRKKVDIEKVKMPKSVSRTKAKNGTISYDVDSLANRFGALYPEYKNEIKKNIAEYGEFLPETFFLEHGNKKVLDIIKNGTAAEQRRLFKMLGEIFEDGTNEVQDVIGVTILGEMKNDPKMMAVADKYMDNYMAGPVHEINKITEKNNKFTKKLKNPPAYKPKKKRGFNPSTLNDMNNR